MGSAVIVLVRAEWRRRAGALVALALLCGLVAAVVLAGFAGARRTASSLDRFVAENRPPDAFLIIDGLSDTTITSVRELPIVEESSTGTTYAASAPDGLEIGLLAPEDDRIGRDFDRIRVMRGRLPDPGRADELLFNEAAAAQASVQVGDTLRLATYTPAQMEQLATGAEQSPLSPQGPPLELRVVGIGRVPVDLAGRGEPQVLATPAFDRLYAGRVATAPIARLVALRLRPGATVDQLQDAIDPLLPPDKPYVAIDAAKSLRPAVRAISVLAVALTAFSVVAAITSCVVVAQVIARHVSAASDDDETLRALGLPQGARVASRALGVVPAAIGGAVGAVVASALASSLFPIGLARKAEPKPGVSLDMTVLVLGALVLVGLVVFVAAASAWFRRRPAKARRPSQVAFAARGAGPIVATGVRLALDRRRPALPVRFALLATTVAVLGVVAALSFSASLGRLVDNRARWGYTWDLLVDDVPSAPQKTIDALLDDPHVAAVAEWSTAFTTVNGEGARAFGLERARGSIGFDLLEGRQPIGRDEVVIGPNLANRLRVHIGDTVQVSAPGPTPSAAPVRVVGIALFPDKDEGNFTGAVGFTGAGFAIHAADPLGPPEVRTAITLAPNVALADEVHRLDEELPGRVSSSSYPFRPGDVANLASVRAFPGWLAIFVAALGVAALAHMVVTTIRRRHTELATLRALGLTPRQLTHCLQWQGVTIAAVGLAAGLPLGIIGGRLTWHAVAKPIGVATDTRQPIGPEALFAAGLVVFAALLAAFFARALNRRPPAYDLRTE